MPVDTRILVFLLPFSALLMVAMYYGGWEALKEWLAKLETPVQLSELDACAPNAYHTRIVPGEAWGNAVMFEFNEPPQHAITYRTPEDAKVRLEQIEVHMPWRTTMHLAFINGTLTRYWVKHQGNELRLDPTPIEVASATALLTRVRTIA